MGREFNMTAQRQNFWKEVMLKEAETRVKWWREYKAEHPKTSRSKTAPKETIKLPPIRTASAREKPGPEKKVVPETPRGAEESTGQMLESASEMKPVTPRTKELLYHGISHNLDGRYSYLHARKMKKPEDRYYYPLTTSWDYGWQLGNMEFKIYGNRLTHIVQDTFFRKNGVFFPDHSNELLA
ncbi:protein SPMIP1 [Latimeria chalumnae]|uniref:Sperm microtubule inner protein 1 C-terminal domain-containing protein n=1 Tax=Latimeria chalumnae TaxID=7897 RepID=H3A2R1_LATCH|nr:PREDICTED: uncharacterized protein LOC106706830 [Latimeria chalumnae]|eukprot:XP_014353782.1 PREDICTED: uncharacterized protein LOC106706830 [Latimeria chalumnae]